jgi:hypothetical protein
MALFCAKCADRAVAYRERALFSQPYAQRALETLRSRLLATPPTASIRMQHPFPVDLFSYSLKHQDVNRILANGQAIASLPTRDRDGYWLTIRLVHLGQVYHLVLHYEWPAPPERWILVASRIYIVDDRYDPDGYPSCFCSPQERNR